MGFMYTLQSIVCTILVAIAAILWASLIIPIILYYLPWVRYPLDWFNAWIMYWR